jgi:hypothetical protein
MAAHERQLIRQPLCLNLEGALITLYFRIRLCVT